MSQPTIHTVPSFEMAFKAYPKFLPDLDLAQVETIGDLVWQARFELDLYEEKDLGTSIKNKRQADRVRDFILAWEPL